MKLRSKDGRTEFMVKNKATDELIEVNIEGYLQDWQERKMDGNPQMIWKFAKFLKEEYGRMGVDVEVYASR